MIVAVINLKGGVGKTTTAMALATEAARQGDTVTVLDTDSQSSASLWAYNAAERGDELPFEVRSANMVDLKRMASGDGPEGLIIIDTPPSGKVTDVAGELADFVIVPTSPSSIDLQQTTGVVEQLENAGKPYAVLLVRVESNTLAAKNAREYFKEHDASTFDTEIPKRADLSNVYSQLFASNLHGYEDVYKELKEALQ